MGRYAEVESILSDYSGLDIQSVGRQVFETATESRLSQTSPGSYADYLRKLEAGEDELSRLLDLLVVPETWFFRDSGAFAFLASFLRNEWSRRTDRRVLNVLSAPCSTGEEPYSIAVTLLEAGLDPSQFRIHASDICSKAIAAAKAGHYRRASFRRPLTAAQSRFFSREEERATVCESVRSVVTFRQGNMVDPNFIAGSEAAYDIVFCKNLMIYLGDSGRAKVLANLNRLLKERGLLFVGHSEVPLFQKAGYTPVSSARAFGLTKTTDRPEMPPPRPRSRMPRLTIRENAAGPGMSRAVEKQAESRAEAAAETATMQPLLATARNLADRGDLQEAARLCRSLIGADSMDVGAYYLAGLIEQSLDRLAPAEDLFLKAIYLDPDHYETLVQLCLLSEKRGDSAKAGQYRKRIQRLDAGGKRG